MEKKVSVQNGTYFISLGETDNIDNPMIAGTFNQWKFERMYSLQELCMLIDKYEKIEAPDFMNKPVYDRSKKEEVLAKKYEDQVDDKYRKIWSRVFDRNLIYDPFYENFPNDYSTSEDTYVYINFLKPSKHDYVVLENTDEDLELSYNQ